MTALQQNLLVRPATPYAPLVTFRWGSTPNYRKYARWTSDVDAYPDTFISAPEMEISFDKPLNVGSEDAPATISIRADREPMDTLSLPFPHAPVHVKIEEINPLDPDTRREIYFGRVGMCDASLRGGHLTCKLTIEGIKTRLTHIVGLQALSSCIWPFGDESSSPCKVPLESKRITATITQRQVGGNPVRIQTDLDPYDLPDPYTDLSNLRWSNGYADLDGNRIKIRASLGNGQFDLRSVPPPSWEGQAIILTPGCDKSVANCRYWNNESRFMGFGIGMPGANPIFSARR